jgi:hypothetical protein
VAVTTTSAQVPRPGPPWCHPTIGGKGKGQENRKLSYFTRNYPELLYPCKPFLGTKKGLARVPRERCADARRCRCVNGGGLARDRVGLYGSPGIRDSRVSFTATIHPSDAATSPGHPHSGGNPQPTTDMVVEVARYRLATGFRQRPQT